MRDRFLRTYYKRNDGLRILAQQRLRKKAYSVYVKKRKIITQNRLHSYVKDTVCGIWGIDKSWKYCHRVCFQSRYRNREINEFRATFASATDEE